jgi:hypothetical protein
MLYTSDNGTAYQRRTWADTAAAAGNTVEAAGAHPRLPSNIKPRYVLGQDATGKQHKLVIGASNNPLFVGGDTTAAVPDPNNRGGATIDLNIMGKIAEKRYSRWDAVAG